MMSKKYLIKLIPYDKFFFGGENTFGEGESRNYYVKSNYYPQQTTLLGLIRYQLMVQNSSGVFEQNKIKDQGKATKLINHKSFEITDTSFSFGKIQGLSPVFIAGNNDEYLFPANKEYQWVAEEDGEKINKYHLRQYATEKGSSSIYKENKFIPYLLKYDPKKDLPDLLINSKGNLLNYSDVFIEQKQIGIRKNYKGKSEENAFYVQFFYKLKKGYSFAFILELEDGVVFKTNELVSIGGEQSKFRMEVSEKDIDFDKIISGYDYEKSNNISKIVLVSDAFISNEIFNDCAFAVTDTIDFRSMKSTVSTKNYSKLNSSDGVSKSSKYNFFKRGSVFYGEDIFKITAHLDDTNNGNEKSPLKKIGYNHYKIVDKEGSKL